MKRLALLLCLVALIVPSAFADGLCTDPANIGQNVLTPGFNCTLGPLLFQNFSASAIGFPVGWTPFIAIGTGIVGSNETGFTGNHANLFFQTNFNTNQFSFRDISFGFRVIGDVTGIDGWIGGSGTRSMVESACADPDCADVTYGTLTLDQDNRIGEIIIPVSTDVWIFKNISLFGTPTVRATMSEFSQSFTVPEPLTLVLVGSGLLGLGLLRRRIRS